MMNKQDKKHAGWQQKTGAVCGCKVGEQRDNCPACEGTGQKIDFKAICGEGLRRDRGTCRCDEHY